MKKRKFEFKTSLVLPITNRDGKIIYRGIIPLADDLLYVCQLHFVSSFFVSFRCISLLELMLCVVDISTLNKTYLNFEFDLFLYFFIFSSLFPYFNLFVSIFIQSYANIKLHVSTVLLVSISLFKLNIPTLKNFQFIYIIHAHFIINILPNILRYFPYITIFHWIIF
jgi:hypothetical protein